MQSLLWSSIFFICKYTQTPSVHVPKQPVIMTFLFLFPSIVLFNTKSYMLFWKSRWRATYFPLHPSHAWQWWCSPVGNCSFWIALVIAILAGLEDNYVFFAWGETVIFLILKQIHCFCAVNDGLQLVFVQSSMFALFPPVEQWAVENFLDSNTVFYYRQSLHPQRRANFSIDIFFFFKNNA